MSDQRRLPVVQSSDDGLSRRRALQNLAAGFGAAVAVPGLADADPHPVHAHLPAIAEQTRRRAAQPAQPSFTPAVFDAHQFATLTLLADLIVPGARATGVPEFLDTLLAVERPDTRRRMLTALGAFDGAALREYKKPFTSLTAAEQTALLTTASTQASSRAPVFWKKGDPIPLPEAPAGPATLRDHFEHLKGWVAGIYYASEPGLKELGWTNQLFHPSFPGCEHGGKHA